MGPGIGGPEGPGPGAGAPPGAGPPPVIDKKTIILLPSLHAKGTHSLVYQVEVELVLLASKIFNPIL